MKGRGKGFLAAGAGLVLGSFVGLTGYAVLDLLIKTGMDRQEPRLLRGMETRISGARGGADYAAALEEAMAAQKKRVTEPVEITARDGTRLAGHWAPVKDPRRAVLAVHGWRGDWTQAFGMMADFLEDRGCSVLYIDQRGTNGSEGEYIGFGLLERLDCADWLNWLAERCPGLPLYMMGMSMGGTSVLMAAGEPLPETLRGIVADSAFTSPKAILEHVARSNLHLPFGITARAAESAFRRKLGTAADSCSTVETLKKCRIPVLLVHGGRDRFVPPDMAFENYRACAGPRRLFFVPGADHVGCWFTDGEGYRRALTDLWREYDNVPDAAAESPAKTE
jgi:hypothetical protein